MMASTMVEAGARGPDRRDMVLSAVLFALLFAIYAAGACRTIYVGDSGELLTAVHVLGIPHPSGYPLYVLLGKLWTLLVPLGSVAWEMSLFSGACAAGACALLFLTARESGCGRVASLLAAAALAFAPSYWLEANTQRVYALNAVFVVLTLRNALRWYRERVPRDLVLAMFLAGLGATNHTFMGLVGIAIAIFAPSVDRSLFRKPKLVAACGGAFFAGLLVYLYLPIRSRFDPVLDWGNPETPRAMLDVVLRRDFWGRRWYESPSDLLAVGWDFLSSAAPETGWVALPLAVIALFATRRNRGVIGLPLLVAAVNVLALAIHGSYYDVFVWHRYYIPGYAMLAFLAALGLEAVAAKVDRRLVAAALLAPVVMLLVGYARHDLSRYRIAEDYSSKLLASLPPGAKLLATDDNVLFVLLYLLHVEQKRPDVELILQGVDQDKPNLSFNPDYDAVYFAHHPLWKVDGLEIVPVGLGYRAFRAGVPHPEPSLPSEIEGERDERVPKDFLTRSLLSNYHFMEAISFERLDWSRANRALERTTEIAPESDIAFHNVGLIYARNGWFEEGVAAYSRCHAINPRGMVQGVRSTRAPGQDRVSCGSEADEVRRERDRIRKIEESIEAGPDFPAVPRGSEAWELEIAARLDALGEPVAARGHRLRAALAPP